MSEVSKLHNHACAKHFCSYPIHRATPAPFWSTPSIYIHNILFWPRYSGFGREWLHMVICKYVRVGQRKIDNCAKSAWQVLGGSEWVLCLWFCLPSTSKERLPPKPLCYTPNGIPPLLRVVGCPLQFQRSACLRSRTCVRKIWQMSQPYSCMRTKPQQPCLLLSSFWKPFTKPVSTTA